MNKSLYLGAIGLILFSSSLAYAQKAAKFNLAELLKENKFVNNQPGDISGLSDNNSGVACKSGIFWLKNINFSNGTIEVDVKGRDVLQQSFLGIAFHGSDTGKYEAIYLRPFNFQATDSLRKNHAVQYVSYPEYPWERLRKEHPLMYEQPVASSVLAYQWVHVRIVVQDDWVTVYLNNSSSESLKVKKLNNRNDGLLGLWSFGDEEADFANLVIKGKG